ncbi:hypothetical protein HY640_05280 [Candidatus Woesearchaeota archaeon]|nr:hypothetical protein [Candidatus Woesearchaeota archaeon]
MNVAKLAEKYISERPSIKSCLKRKLINYSALSREIQSELGGGNFDAILIACRRIAVKLRKEDSEKRILDILRASRIEIKTKIMAAVLEKPIYYNDLIELQKEVKKKRETIHIMEGTNTITIVTSDEFLDSIRKKFGKEMIKTSKNLAEINVKSPKDIESTSGVLSQLCSVFSERGINIVESMSCWTDTLFAINEKDVGKAIEALRLQGRLSI